MSVFTITWLAIIIIVIITRTITFTHTSQPNKLEITPSMWTHSSLYNTTGQRHRMKISQQGGKGQKTICFIFISHLIDILYSDVSFCTDAVSDFKFLWTVFVIWNRKCEMGGSFTLSYQRKITKKKRSTLDYRSLPVRFCCLEPTYSVATSNSTDLLI